MQQDIYSQLIINNYTNPKNFNKEIEYTHSGEGINSSCGDEIYVYFKISDGIVRDVSFKGSGCAICLGGASMFFESIIGMRVENLKNINEEYIHNLVNIPLEHSRSMCVRIPLIALKKLLLTV